MKKGLSLNTNYVTLITPVKNKFNVIHENFKNFNDINTSFANYFARTNADADFIAHYSILKFNNLLAAFSFTTGVVLMKLIKRFYL